MSKPHDYQLSKLGHQRKESKMTEHYKAVRVPWDDSKPIQVVEYDEGGENLEELVFGPLTPGHSSRVCGMSIMNREVQAAYDDEGMFNQPFNQNVRAMKLWAHLSGRKLSDFVQPLWGDFVILGFERDSGDTKDVPQSVLDFFAEEVVVGG